MARPLPVATYRVQLTPANRFEHVSARLDQLAALGISHVYLSPVTEAVPGSTHGYDVVDHTRVRDELGGLDGLLALLDALAARSMAALVDHVPNHVAVGRPELNPRWWAMLRDGRHSADARWFDVDWDATGGVVTLPVLGEPLSDIVAADGVAITGGELRVGLQRFPLAAGTADLPLADALAAQHYRLQHWRRPERNVRRFFTIDDLVAVRVEDPAVAAAVDTVPRLLVDHPGFGGVRVDHVDGLADPGAYLAGLRQLVGDRWLLVEKILAPGETLPADWPVDGTTGYEHARVLEHALLDADGFARLRARWDAATEDARPYARWEADARREVLAEGLLPDVERVTRAAVAAGVNGDVADAVSELSARLRRYRTYLPHDPAGLEALRAAYTGAAVARPELAPALDGLVGTVAAGPSELRTRWQQLTGPATAKGVEDRAFYRYVPLAPLCEVGGEPVPDGGDPVAALHDWHGRLAERWPRGLLAGTTHDSKRSEDVRARGLALADEADRWEQLLDAWASATDRSDRVDPAMQWLALQTVVSAGPLAPDRLAAYLQKAAREAAVHTTWADPDESYEAALDHLAAVLARWAPAGQLTTELDRLGRARSLAMLTVRTTAPGVPDVYQGTEAFRFLLVDPDNRTEPDADELDAVIARAAELDGPAAWREPGAPAARAVVLRRALAARSRVDLVGYQPVVVVGPGREDVIAFARLDADAAPVLITAVPRAGTAVDAALPLPPGTWRHVLDDGLPEIAVRLELGPVFARFPASVLVRAA